MLFLGLHTYSLFPTVWRSVHAVFEAYLSWPATKTACREGELQAPGYGTTRSWPSVPHKGEEARDAAALHALAAPPRDTRRFFYVGGVAVGIVILCTPGISRSTAPAAAVVRVRSMRPPVAAFRVVPGGRLPTLP